MARTKAEAGTNRFLKLFEKLVCLGLFFTGQIALHGSKSLEDWGEAILGALVIGHCGSGLGGGAKRKGTEAQSLWTMVG